MAFRLTQSHSCCTSLSYQSSHHHSQNLRGGFSLHLCSSCHSPPKRPINRHSSSLSCSCQSLTPSTSTKQEGCFSSFWGSPYVLPFWDSLAICITIFKTGAITRQPLVGLQRNTMTQQDTTDSEFEFAILSKSSLTLSCRDSMPLPGL